MIIGAMCLSNLFDMKSVPELNLGLSCLQIFKMSVSDILKKSKFTGLLSDKKLSNGTFEDPISEAKFGPTSEKKELNPFAISI